MLKSDYEPYLADAQFRWPWGPWAYYALRAGRIELIGQRVEPARLYIARFWLTAPQRQPNGRLDFANSILLHHFLESDDDGALHDHPASGETTILSGGYDEAVPPPDWDALSGKGPRTDYIIKRHMGERRPVVSTQLHSIVAIRPDTWTLFQTGPRSRRWGFWPEGESWVDADTYLQRIGKEQ